MIRFNTNELLPADCLGWEGTGVFSMLIRRVIGSRRSHDAPLIPYNGHWYVGDAVSPFAKLTPLSRYEEDMAKGKGTAVIHRVAGATDAQREAAARWWVLNALGKPYDWMAFPRLFLKATFKDIFPRAAGWKWANWCTEGYAKAWKFGASLDLYANENPTPRHTERLVEAGTLVEVKGALYDDASIVALRAAD